MTLGDIGAIGGIIAGVVAIVGALWVIFSFYNKVNRIDRSVKALVIIHSDELTKFYKDNIGSLYNPQPPPDRDILLAKLERGFLTTEEANRLEGILKWEEAEAIRKNQQKALLAIGALLALVYIISRKK